MVRSSSSPYINSLSIVPVGITKYRQHLCELIPYDKKESEKIIDQVKVLQKNYREKHNCNFVYAADEFYIMAKKEIPEPDEYDGYPQIENGVGLIASFAEEVRAALENDLTDLSEERKITIVTGLAALGFMKKTAAAAEEKIKNLKIKVLGIRNSFFGDTVTVAGLVTGNDIINSLRGKDLGAEVLFPSVMLKADENIFLDNTTPEELSDTFGVKFTPVYVSGYDFIDKLTGRLTDV